MNKQHYHKPTLQIYGNIAVLTQTINGTMMPDSTAPTGANRNRTS
jgi:hypothetical protein